MESCSTHLWAPISRPKEGYNAAAGPRHMLFMPLASGSSPGRRWRDPSLKPYRETIRQCRLAMSKLEAQLKNISGMTDFCHSARMIAKNPPTAPRSLCGKPLLGSATSACLVCQVPCRSGSPQGPLEVIVEVFAIVQASGNHSHVEGKGGCWVPGVC